MHIHTVFSNILYVYEKFLYYSPISYIQQHIPHNHTCPQFKLSILFFFISPNEFVFVSVQIYITYISNKLLPFCSLFCLFNQLKKKEKLRKEETKKKKKNGKSRERKLYRELPYILKLLIFHFTIFLKFFLCRSFCLFLTLSLSPQSGTSLLFLYFSLFLLLAQFSFAHLRFLWIIFISHIPLYFLLFFSFIFFFLLLFLAETKRKPFSSSSSFISWQ